MRNKKRIKPILNRIEKIWNKYPDLRLGQLMMNCFDSSDVFYIEDDELIESIEEEYKDE